MNNKLLTIATFTLFLSGQAAMAGDNSEEFLSWLESGNDVAQVDQSSRFNKVSMVSEGLINSNEADAFSLDFSSDK